MGQHKTNPVAMAAKLGELKPIAREKYADLIRTMRSVLEKIVGGRAAYYVASDGSIRRHYPKVKGKAAVKRARRARRVVH